MASAEGSSSVTHFHNQASVANQAQTQNIHGNPQFHTHTHVSAPTVPPNYDFGIRLGRAPQIDDDLFVGREEELQKLQTWLKPCSGKRNVVALYGLGGIGKTQLSIQYIRQCGGQYSSVFWLNAQDEKTLQRGLAELAIQVSSTSSNAPPSDAQQDDTLAQQARYWLSEPGNDQWLVVYDNYDNPAGFDISTHFPCRAQGSILITTRSSRLMFAKQLHLQTIEDEQQSLSILAKIIGRPVQEDSGSVKLVQRLGGLPLALVTAGAYLRQSTSSCREYLRLYENNWNDLSQNTYTQPDYERTLYSTWNISFQQVSIEDSAAAELLRLLAFLDHRDIRYGFLYAGRGLDTGPEWWTNLTRSRPRLHKALATLHDYSLINITKGRYDLHPCVHDWILEHLNATVHVEHVQIAVHCIITSVPQPKCLGSRMQIWQQQPNLYRLQHGQIKAVMMMMMQTTLKLPELIHLALIYKGNRMWTQAKKVLKWALRSLRKGSDLMAIYILELLCSVYEAQGRMLDGEMIIVVALNGADRILGSDDAFVLSLALRLGMNYHCQGRLDQAEEIYLKVLLTQERILGHEHEKTLHTINFLGMCYKDRGLVVEAEKMWVRVLKASKKLVGMKCSVMIPAVSSLANIYLEQRNFTEVESMYVQAIEINEQVFGLDSLSTLEANRELGMFYIQQRKIAKAKEFLNRELTGYKKLLRASDVKPRHVVAQLLQLRYEEGGMTAIEELLNRLLPVRKLFEGQNFSVQKYQIANIIASLHSAHGDSTAAQEWCERALQG